MSRGSDWTDPGEGDIPPEQIIPVLRILRHNQKNLKTVVDAQQGLLREVMTAGRETHNEVKLAKDAAVDIKLSVASLRQYLVGANDIREDTGLLGELKDTQRRITQQQWAILVMLLGAITTAIVTGHH